jgi:hypothetical protein
MLETLPATLPFMIPILGILLGFAVVAGIFVVQPLTKALSQLAERQGDPTAGGAERRLESLEARMASMEGTLERLVAVQEFHRELEGGAVGKGPASPGSRTLGPEGARRSGASDP